MEDEDVTETSMIVTWGTTRDLGFPVSKDKDLVITVRDTVEDQQMKFNESGHISRNPSFLQQEN